ncbi:MAG: Crp/Fnr family transcriptional regulator [Propionibacteriaceae bacterium]|nr:Crp/Fnr family transcriptional regulator [Propionibacteriaceae bacterium]
MGLLARVPLFAEIDLGDLGAVAARNAVVSLEAGEILFRQGDPCAGFFHVATGRMRLSVGNPEGSVTTVEIIGRGETFGEAVVFLAQPYPVTATALAASTLYFVASAFVDALLDTSTSVARRLLANLASRNHRLVADRAALTLDSARQRVCSYLVEHGRALTATGGLAEATLVDAKKEVAARLGLTPESLSRVLRQLADEGLIVMSGSVIRFAPRRLVDQRLR